MCADQPGGTTTVVAHSSTIAGPDAEANVSRSVDRGLDPAASAEEHLPELLRRRLLERRRFGHGRTRDVSDRTCSARDQLERRVECAVPVQLYMRGGEALPRAGEQRGMVVEPLGLERDGDRVVLPGVADVGAIDPLDLALGEAVALEVRSGLLRELPEDRGASAAEDSSSGRTVVTATSSR